MVKCRTLFRAARSVPRRDDLGTVVFGTNIHPNVEGVLPRQHDLLYPPARFVPVSSGRLAATTSDGIFDATHHDMRLKLTLSSHSTLWGLLFQKQFRAAEAGANPRMESAQSRLLGPSLVAPVIALEAGAEAIRQ